MTKELLRLVVAALSICLHAGAWASAVSGRTPVAWGEPLGWGDEGPAAREHPSVMVFDGLVVVLGGSGYEPQGAPLGDAWAYEPESGAWRSLALTGDVPDAAGSRRVAQAPGADSAWLFGGYGANFETNNELYRVRLTSGSLAFELIEQEHPPTPRALHAFAVDPGTGSLIVTHGVSRAGFMDDTHLGELEGDGRVVWRRLEREERPSPRFGFAFGFDRDHGELVVFSGQMPGSQDDPMPMSDELWVLRVRGDSPGWTRIDMDTPPPGRRNPMFAYDDRGDRLVVWCGTADARSNIPGLVVIHRDGRGSWHATSLSDAGAPPRRSSGVGFVAPGSDRVYLGFGNSREGRYREWVPLDLGTTAGSAGKTSADEPRVKPTSEAVTADAVEDAVREYVFAKYAGDDETVRSRAHHDIARRAVSASYWGRPSEEWVRPYGHDVLRFYGTRANTARRDDPESGRCEITVYDVESSSASASVVMDDVVDFMHLVRFEGRWMIADSAVIILDEAGSEPPAATRQSAEAIRDVIRDYCMGFYETDGDKVQRTCHSMLSKRSVARWPEGRGFDYFQRVTWEEIRILGDTFNRHYGFDPETARCEIEVYEIRENIALAKLTGSVWFDYFQLMNVRGEWKIVNIIFETLPEERSEAA